MFQNQKYIPDPHSFAKPEEAVVQHLDLDIIVSFAERKISGSASYQIAAVPTATQIIVDTRALIIKKIYLDDTEDTAFSLGEEKPFLGRPLNIPIKPQTQKITIWYETTEHSAALQWLNPVQTADKQHQFLFTQSQAILARTWLPCQDSPGIRFTYAARVQVPPAYLALMSAENPQQKNSNGIYSFQMNQPIPSYLMALAVGDLKFKAFSPNTGVYAEPAQLNAAEYEFAELPQMLTAAENLYGKYLWERYDLLLLPPSFPFGGMENPRLTFVTPTIIAGDRSLTSLVAHELAHSWSGNLVTNATWNDFWLNEGFTVYFERRIMEALYGKDYADMLKVLGYQDLQHTLDDIGRESVDTHLRLNLENRDPDEGLTEIAYEKGNYFLLALEEAVGREKFDQFIREYFKAFAFKSMDTETFLDYLQANLLNAELNNIPAPEEWIYQPDIPVGGPLLKSDRFEQVQKVANAWQNSTPASELPTSNWSTHEWLYFLNAIVPILTKHKMQELDAAFHFTRSGNSEIVAIWLTQAIRHRYEPAYPTLEDFLIRIGRRKLLMPLYKELLQHDREKAFRIYAKARKNYHAVTTSSLDELVK